MDPERDPPSAVVITGGAGGVGQAIGHTLHQRGYRVVLGDLDGDAAALAAAAIGDRAEGCRLDVTDPDACLSLARETDARHGLAVWVNNAGLLRCGPSWEQGPALQRMLFDVNTHGVINGTQAALSVFRDRGNGHVVNIISLAGLVAPPGETLYAATKHAALAYSLGTLADLRQHGHADVHVSAVCPDGVWTPMLHGLVDDPEAAPSWEGVMLGPDDVAAVVAELLIRPRPVRSIPRWRGALVRVYAALPSVGIRLAPRVMARARRRQAAFRGGLNASRAPGGDRPAPG